jgi:hypothetical protein
LSNSIRRQPVDGGSAWKARTSSGLIVDLSGRRTCAAIDHNSLE